MTTPPSTPRRLPGAIARVLRLLNIDPYGDLLSSHSRERFAKATSPRYLVSKLRLVLYEKRHPDHPWLTADAIALVADFLRPHHVGLEWGSGNGSRWFAKRSGSLVSVEHNRAWYDKVRALFEREHITNIDYRFVDEDRYTAVIDDFPDEHFDYVLVDGLFRDVAFLKSIPKLKRGGWIIFDNVNWYLPSNSRTPHSRTFSDGPESPAFAEVARLVADWHVTWTTNGVNDTAIYIKP